MGTWLENNWHFIFGLIPQSLFSARMFVQWIMSEKSKKVVSPVIYWQLSLIASFLFLFYGWLRADFAIILGQVVSYYIYIWNLNILNQWGKINKVLRYMVWFTPVIVISMLTFSGKGDISRLWTDIPFGLLIFGSIAQLLFAFRFIYQWWYSRRYSQSILPDGFWILSIVGSICNLIYGFIRMDYVLIIGHGAGFITYSRNLYLNHKNRHDN